ncbi:hypothetical protein LXL04_037744 [Taraxacum kok-saghyz]
MGGSVGTQELEGHFFKKTVSNSTVPVQDKALDALFAYLKASAGRFAKEVDAIVPKCLTGGPKSMEKAQIVFMLWVELEAVDAFLDAMDKAIKAKVAKAVVPAIDVMFQALSEFGSKIVPPKRILKMLPELFDHQDKIFKKELEAKIVNVTASTKPTRKIRFVEVATEAAGSGPSEESTAEVSNEIDEYKLVDPVDIRTPLEKTVFWNGVKATKWSERRDVAELTKLASTKRIAPGDISEECHTLKKLIIDSSLAVAVEAVQVLGNLAAGLRTNLSASSRFRLPYFLDKLKVKKPIMTMAHTNTPQAMHKAGNVKLDVKNKVPLVRFTDIELGNMLHLHCLNDGTPKVRNVTFSVLAAIAKMVGMRPLEKSLEKLNDLDDVRQKKALINDWYFWRWCSSSSRLNLSYPIIIICGGIHENDAKIWTIQVLNMMKESAHKVFVEMPKRR